MQAQNSFGALLRQYRLASGFSQEALATRANLSARTISDLERSIHGAPRADTLTLLSDALSLTPPQRTLLLSLVRPSSNIPRALGSMLPLLPTRLLGREQERTHALDLLRRPAFKLLTLTGPSGVGKTRLAIQLAQDLVDEYTFVAYVSLAPIRDVTLIPRAVALAFGIQELADSSTLEQMQAYLQDHSTLLVLDNMEHILDAAIFIADLLIWCPGLTILATSRVPLHLRAEQEMLLAPLPSRDAVHLFCERAQAIRPERVYPTREVAAICTRVDNLPLAIELAAIQVRALSLSELYHGLTQRLALLRDGARDLPIRQQTMENAIAWSYDLLTAEQQRCFRVLGVFIGGWSREGAEALCWEQDKLTGEKGILTLASLVDASLIYAEIAPNGTMRFGMLELIQDYAQQQLRLAGEAEYYQRKHARYYAHIAESILEYFGPKQGVRDNQFTKTLAQELPNARAALQWAEVHRDAKLGLLLSGFARLWHICGQMSEAEFWFERMLALDHQAREQGQPTAPISQRIAMLAGFGRTLVRHGRSEHGAASFAEEALSLAQSIGDYNGMSTAFETLGMIAQVSGLLDEAQGNFEACYAYAPDGLTSRALVHLAEVARMRGDLSRATALAKEALIQAQSIGTTWDVALISTLLGQVASQELQYTIAKAYYREALKLYRSFASPSYVASCLEGLADILSAEERYAQATRMYAVSVTLREQAQIALTPHDHEVFAQRIVQIKSVFDASVFEMEWEKGRGLSQDEAIAESLSDHISKRA